MNTPDPVITQAQELLKNGQAARVVDMLAPACDAGSATAIQFYYYGIGLAESGRLGEAIAAFRSAAGLAPENIAMLTNLGRAYVASGSHAQAVEPLNKALSLNPSHRPAQLFLLNAYISLEEAEKAEVLCDTLLAATPFDNEVLMQFGMVRKLQKRYDEAMQIYDQLLAVSPDSVPVIINKGLLLQSMKRIPDAIEQFDRAVSLSPEMAAAWRILAIARLACADLNGAIDAFDRAFSLAPSDTATGIQLAKALRHAGRLEESEEACRKVLVTEPDNAEAKFFQDAFSKQSNKQKLDRIPAEVSKQIYSGKSQQGSLGSGFDTSLQNSLEYKAPTVLDDAVRAALDGRENIDVLELGCGSGLCGSKFADISDRLIGTDISPGMLEGARQKDVYTELYEADLIDALDNYEDEIDLVIAMDVLCFFGDLTDIFQRTRRALHDDGLFGFSVVKPKSDASWELQEYGHFVHSTEHIRNVAVSTGCTELFIDELPLRKEMNEDQYGYVCVFRKSQK